MPGLSPALSRRRLDWLVRARGTDLSAWPDADRQAALLLMRSSPEAQLAFAEALGAEDAPEGDEHDGAAAAARIQSAVRRHLAPLSPLVRSVWIGALCGCVGAGLYLASAQDLAPAAPDTDADLFTSAQTISLAALDQ